MTFPSVLKELAGSLLAAVFPTACPLCHRELTQPDGASVCSDCWASIQHWTGASCGQCGLPLAAPSAVTGESVLCGHCRQGRHEFDLARSYGVYTGNLRKAILQFKFQGRSSMDARLGRLLKRAWDDLPETNSPIVMPVPLHSARRRERGFNQAELLAKGLIDVLRKQGMARGVRYVTHSLRRTRATVPQVGLSEAARRENVHGVFSVERQEEVRDQTIIIVDDVMTTGATFSACALTLKKAGAAHVFALSLARATPQFPDMTLPSLNTGIDEFGDN